MQGTEESLPPRSHSCTESDVRTYLLCVRMKVLSYENRNLKMNTEEVQGAIKLTTAMDVQRRAR